MTVVPDGTKIPEFEFQGQPLDKENTGRLLSLVMLGMQGVDVPMEEDGNIADLFLTKVASKRIKAYGLPFNLSNLFFVASVMTFVTTPGMVMGLLWLAKRYADRTQKTLLKIEDWCEIFPFGTPREEDQETWWDAQKVTWDRKSLESDNMVDYPSLWGSSIGVDEAKESMVV